MLLLTRDFVREAVNFSLLVLVSVCLFGLVFGLSVAVFEGMGEKQSLMLEAAAYKNPLEALFSGGKQLDLIIVKTDHSSQSIDITVTTTAPEGKGQITTYLNFISGYVQMEKLALIEVSREKLRSNEKPVGPGWTQYKGSVTISFDSHLTRFPFDEIPLAVATEQDKAFSPGDDIDREAISSLWVENTDPDYALFGYKQSTEHRGGNTYFFFKLARNNFVIYLAMFLVFLGLVSSIVLIRGFKLGKGELPLLTYFVGLWAIRGIVVGGLQGPRPFPTYVDLAVIILFFFALVGCFFRNASVPKGG
jgi:hypothetical protein